MDQIKNALIISIVSLIPVAFGVIIVYLNNLKHKLEHNTEVTKNTNELVKQI